MPHRSNNIQNIHSIHSPSVDHFSNNNSRVVHPSNVSRNIDSRTQQTERNGELFQFLSDNDARTHLMDLRDEVNIRELAQSYDVKNKNKKKKKIFSYSPTVFLLRKRKNNRVPIPGHPK